MLYKINLPLKIKMRGKNYQLNLNQYRNWYYYVSNLLKKIFRIQIQSQADFKAIPKFKQIHTNYTVFAPDKRLFDLDNKIIVQKFFQDTLVKEGKIGADDYKQIISYAWLPVQFDKKNPRVECDIVEVEHDFN